jgi:8-oxo-dGTP pyrophosphatase MutT (NUDIX family)
VTRSISSRRPQRDIITEPHSSCPSALGLLLVQENRAYGITLQPGGHLEPTDATLIDAAVRELTEETGVDPDRVVPASQAPVYIEYGNAPARPMKDEPAHFHLDIGFSFTTRTGTSAAARRPK